MKSYARRLASVLAAALVTGASLVGGQMLTAAPAAAAPAANCRLPAPAGVGNEHEGPTDYNRWLEPTGDMRAIFLFVDFASAPGTATERNTVEADFDPELADWFATASYGQYTLDLDFTTTWARMPQDHDDYPWPPSYWDHQDYMQDAVDAWDPVVDFSQYDLFYVVSPVAATGIANSPAWISTVANAVLAEGGQVALQHGSTVGADRPSWGYQLLAHETGHVFGLPDLYEYGVASNWHRHVGGWDTMGLVNGPAPDYLAYHKWKLGWLGDSQIACTTSHGWLQQTLTPLHTSGGVKAVVVRIDTSRAVVVENRQGGGAIDGTPASCYQAGVLVYVVDARVGGGGGTLGGTGVVMPVTVVDANSGPLAGCGNGDVAEKANATLTAQWSSVSTNGVFVQVSGVNGADRQVQVSW